MAVPAHDQRDFEFARKYHLPIRVVIQPEGETLDPDAMAEAYVGHGIQVNSGAFDGLPNREAMAKITAHLAEKGCGGPAVTYRLRDWLLSRQRYWGAPIPIIYCDRCGPVPVPEDQLPVLLPRGVEFKPTGESPLAQCEEFVGTTCPKCAGPGRRETDTMDTFVDSSWYYLRYVSPRYEHGPFDPKDVENWLPVDLYIGGIEHATMHLIYFRFFTQVLHDLGLVPFDEPATRLFCQGMVCKTAHYCRQCKWLRDEDVEDGKCKRCRAPVHSEVTKMSKTRLNTVSPDAIVSEYGADTLRLYILSDTPPDRAQVWSDQGLIGANRFLHALWGGVNEAREELRSHEEVSQLRGDMDAGTKGLIRKTHHTIQRATNDIEKMGFNTAIAAVRELMNEVRSAHGAEPGVRKFALATILRLIAPFVPHVAEELWQALGNDPSIFRQGWPEHDAEALRTEQIEVPVQVNARLRARIVVPADASHEDLERAALDHERIKAHTQGKQVRKVIVVPGRMVNIVVA